MRTAGQNRQLRLAPSGPDGKSRRYAPGCRCHSTDRNTGEVTRGHCHPSGQSEYSRLMKLVLRHPPSQPGSAHSFQRRRDLRLVRQGPPHARPIPLLAPVTSADLAASGRVSSVGSRPNRQGVVLVIFFCVNWRKILWLRTGSFVSASRSTMASSREW